MKTIIYTTISINKGSPRLFIEGFRLLSSGVTPGRRYRIDYSPGKVVIRFLPSGERFISKRKRRGVTLPVIDINNKSLADLTVNGRVRVVIHQHLIKITQHHLDYKEDQREQQLFKRIQAGKPINIVSLAHGGGIMDLALHQGLADTQVASRLSAAIELDERYLESSLANNPVWDSQSVAIHGPMEEVEFNLIPSCDLLCAGLPCTGASLAGRAKNRLQHAEEHSSAGALFFTFLQAITILNPAIVVLENVPAYQNTVSMTVIRQVLMTLGYVVHERLINGNEMGALENRERFVMVGLTKALQGFDLQKITPVRHKESTIRRILCDVPTDSSRWKAYQYLTDKAVRDKASGKGFKRQLLTGDEPCCGTIGRGYQKARSTEPFLVQPDTGLQRLFTPVEHARLKTVPESLLQGLSDTVAHEVLGQSVIFSAFVALGRLLGNVIGNLADQSYESGS